MLEDLKKIFPTFNPDYCRFSIADCCGSCKYSESKTYYIMCHLPMGEDGSERNMETFHYGKCPFYERNTKIIWPVLMGFESQYGSGQG